MRSGHESSTTSHTSAAFPCPVVTLPSHLAQPCRFLMLGGFESVSTAHTSGAFPCSVVTLPSHRARFPGYSVRSGTESGPTSPRSCRLRKLGTRPHLAHFPRIWKNELQVLFCPQPISGLKTEREQKSRISKSADLTEHPKSIRAFYFINVTRCSRNPSKMLVCRAIRHMLTI